MTDPARSVSPDRWADLERLAEAALAGGLSSGRWALCPHTQRITCEADNGYTVHVADVRGWGYLTGQGEVCLKLEPGPAYEIQKAWAAHLASANPAAVLDLIAAARGESGGDEAKRSEPTPSPPPTEQAETGGEWIEWSGGENPVPGQMVDVRFRSRGGQLGSPADALFWDHDGALYDITAYRLASPVRGRE